jgi:hypothetical protein
MWHKDHVWLHYVKNIIATDIHSAVFLASYLLYSGLSRDYTSSLEVIDLQRYKVVRKAAKVYAALNKKHEMPFIFVVCKN